MHEATLYSFLLRLCVPLWLKILQWRLSQNFSFWESNLGFMGKNGLQTVFSSAFHKTNRVLGKAPMFWQISALGT
jgi:hypothetical protein